LSPGQPINPQKAAPFKKIINSLPWLVVGCRTKKLDGSAEESERRVALGLAPKIPLKAGCKPALQLSRPAPAMAQKVILAALVELV
jgi:hypothetical protein